MSESIVEELLAVASDMFSYAWHKPTCKAEENINRKFDDPIEKCTCGYMDARTKCLKVIGKAEGRP